MCVCYLGIGVRVCVCNKDRGQHFKIPEGGEGEEDRDWGKRGKTEGETERNKKVEKDVA